MSEVSTLQARLEQALLVSGPADDRELAARIRDEGHRLVFLLNGLLRATRLYSLDNQALEPPAKELGEVLRGLLERLGVVSVVLVEDQAYVNDVRLRVRPAEQLVIDQFAAELGRHEVGGLTFHQALEADSLKALAQAVASGAAESRRTEALGERLRALGDIEVSGRWRFRIGKDEAPGEKGYAEVLVRATDALRDTLSRLGARRMPNPLRVRRVVIDLVDALRRRPDRAALAPFAGPAESTERHLVSVCQLALLLGRALGLPEAALSDLGVTAMLHDVGYLSRPDPKRHSLAGSRILVRQRGFSEAKVRRLLGVLEHHETYLDMGRDDPSPSLFARILHVVEDYDLMVASVAQGAPKLPPATALARMWAGRGASYDPILLALLAQELGLYPPGTVLELSDGSSAVVTRAGQGRERFRLPVVTRLERTTAEGSAREEVDLYEERNRIAVRGLLDPTHAGREVMEVARGVLRAAAAA